MIDKNLVRYSVIEDKNPREIIMLVGSGCKWRKCRFCDYHLDYSNNEDECFGINSRVIKNITGIYKQLEVINSGSFVDLDRKTLNLIKNTCIDKNIKIIHFECHYMYKDKVREFKKEFEIIGIKCFIKLGLETFDYSLREEMLLKGIEEKNPKEIAKYYDEINLLQGIKGQYAELMIRDIETGLKYFKRVCVNIMVENRMQIKPDSKVIKEFMDSVYPKYKDNDRVDILLNNTDFGVG